MAIALEIYEALRSVGVEDAKAKSTAEKFDQALEGRLERELKGLATREDLAQLEARLIKWNVGTIIAVAGLTLAIVKLIG